MIKGKGSWISNGDIPNTIRSEIADDVFDNYSVTISKCVGVGSCNYNGRSIRSVGNSVRSTITNYFELPMNDICKCHIIVSFRFSHLEPAQATSQARHEQRGY